jgi:N2-acetyl-L-2,4-diaminobutanoate deacetylase
MQHGTTVKSQQPLGAEDCRMWNRVGALDFEVASSGTRFETVAISDGDTPVTLSVAQAGTGVGPRVLVCGGTHGDEFEGQIAALELARSLEALSITGRLLVMPFHHAAACRAGQRTSPIDQADLNRLYGIVAKPAHGPSAAIAAFVETRLLPDIDIVIDLHSGGEAFDFVLSGNLQARVGSSEYEAMLPALLAFNAPFGIVFDEAGKQSMPHQGTLEGAARALGKRALSSEIGGGGRLSLASLRVARTGLVNLLHHFGVVRSSLAIDWKESRSHLCALDLPEQHQVAPVSGWFVPAVSLGDQVQSGDLLGTMIADDAPFADPIDIRAASHGIVAALANRTKQAAGEAIVFIARPLNEQK